MRTQLVDADVGAIVGLDDRVHAIAEIVAGQADHRARANTRVLVERGLDLRRIDVGAAGQDHVGLPVGQEQVAVGVHPPHVAERLPPALYAASLGTDVAIRAHGLIVAGSHEDLTDLARLGVAAIGANNLHLYAVRTPDRAAMLEPLAPADDRRGLRFGAGVEFPDHVG